MSPRLTAPFNVGGLLRLHRKIVINTIKTKTITASATIPANATVEQTVAALNPMLKSVANKAWAQHPNNPKNRVPQLTFTREAVAVTPRTAVLLDDLCMAIHCTKMTRQAVADRIIQSGLAAHVGGCHVAVHQKDSAGNIRGERLAIVTGNFGDWV